MEPPDPGGASAGCGGAAVSAADDKFRWRDFIRFTGLLVVAALPVAAGMRAADYGAWLWIWAALIVSAFFFPGWGLLILCGHCPRYGRPGRFLRCHATVLSFKLWKARPGPMSRWERAAFLSFLVVFFSFPLPFLILGGQWGWLAVYGIGAALFGSVIRRTECRRCPNLSCPLNAVIIC